MSELSKEFLDVLMSVKAKRPRTVIDHILKYGFITTEDLETKYGYNHPPRAIRDVRELGIPLDTYRVKSSDGRSIAAYKFGSFEKSQNPALKISGRTVLSKALKQALIDKYGSKCAIYLEHMESAVLQIDHRIPYEIGGECDDGNVEAFMLLSPSANRAKSWTCEHCKNWEEKDAEFCMSCFWAYPENYSHVAGKYERVVSIVFTGNEIDDYNKLINLVGEENAQDFIKNLIHDNLK